jgi:hypothetical protein
MHMQPQYQYQYQFFRTTNSDIVVAATVDRLACASSRQLEAMGSDGHCGVQAR